MLKNIEQKNTVKLKDGFRIDKFIGDTNIDVVYQEKSQDSYTLLALSTAATVDSEYIDNLIENGSSVGIVREKTLEMDLYNLEESVAMTAILNQ